MNFKGLNKRELDEYFDERRKKNLKNISIIVFILMISFSLFGWLGMIDYLPNQDEVITPFIVIFIFCNIITIAVSLMLIIKKCVFLED